ncbi:MAG: hypothetical protein HBSIN02_03200 [Bacteroidia bacterium]|nr:MAG: hypothetical protein HBSIN02_03200 [Bacteroidia bacterium]
MPFDVQVDADHARCTVRGYGSFDFKQAVDALLAVTRDSRYAPGMALHFDVRKMEFVPTPDESWKLALTLRSLRKTLTGKIAVVVSAPLHYGVARVISTYAAVGGIRMKPFLKEQEAIDWLTADDPGEDE